MLRINGGFLKGREFSIPASVRARPMAAANREAIFNVLGDKIVNARVIDLFGGSGQLSFEAISRGAEFAEIIELDRRTASAIIENAGKLGIDKSIRVRISRFPRIIKKHEKNNQAFDVVFADPPYFFYNPDRNDADSLTGENGAAGVIRDGGLLFLAHPSRLDTEKLNVSKKLEYSDTYEFGNTAFSTFRRVKEE